MALTLLAERREPSGYISFNSQPKAYFTTKM